MNRIKLKQGGKPRHKAFAGADGAIMAAATLAAAGINAAATAASANKQAKAAIQNAETQAQSIKEQSENNTSLQKEQIQFTREQNQENRQQQQDIQTTLQMMAGKENTNDRLAQNKMQLKYGGKRKQLGAAPFYGGAQFRVTDGGGAIPLAISPQGYGLYELFGNDHEHYHKTSGGKNKTGVGIKFNDGSVIEGEGNQNTNQGELLYVTPGDAMFISKHSIDGFNPAKAVLQGVPPQQAFNIQEYLKYKNGINDDGSKDKHRSIKKMLGGPKGFQEQANITQNPSNGTASVVGGMIYGLNNNTSFPVEGLQKTSVAKCGGRIRLKHGGRRKAANGNTWSWDNMAGATYNAAGNLVGAGITTLGNMMASNKLGRAYTKAGNILSNAYSQMKGIDLDEIKREDYAAPHTMAVIRDSNNFSYNPQREQIRRNAAAERREINRGTLSSAARQQRLAASNDRTLQRMSEVNATENNEREKIRQANAERITNVATENANRDVAANKDYANQRMSLMQYNNNIENAKIAGVAQSAADALTQSATARAQGLQTSMNAIGSSLANAGSAFATAYDTARKDRNDFTNTYVGLGNEDKVSAAIIRYEQTGDSSYIDSLLNSPTVNEGFKTQLRNALTTKKTNRISRIKLKTIAPNYNTYNTPYYLS